MYSNHFFILTMILLSGLVAYLGDLLGVYIGKKKLTFWGMRPRKTARAISVLMGITITIMTLILAAIISSDVRDAILKIGEIKQDLENHRIAKFDLEAELSEVRSRYSRLEIELKELSEMKRKLEAEITGLEKSLETKKKHSVVFFANQMLDFAVINSGDTPETIESKYLEMITRVVDFSRAMSINVEDPLNIWEKLRNPLMMESQRIAPNEQLVVCLYTTQNVMRDEDLGNVRIVARDNRMIYTRNTVITGTGTNEKYSIDGSMSKPEIKLAFSDFLENITEDARNRGMIVSPFANLDSIEFHDLINKIHELDEEIFISVEVLDDIYITGPFFFEIQFEKRVSEN